MKKYIANTDVSINIVLSSGKNRHISFDSVTGGGSVFYTDDEDLQKAIESHYKFGKLFRVDTSFVQSTTTHKKTFAKKTEVNESADAEETENETEETEDIAEEGESTNLKKVTVTDIDDAKSYLAETFGISRTQLRSKAAIVKKAAENGIEFEGI